MVMIPWDKMPERMKNKEVRVYYDLLKGRLVSLIIKRGFDIVVSMFMIIILSPILLLLAIWIKADSKGPAIFKQVRVTQYGRNFKIWKFRTMVNDAESRGTQVTTNNDTRITNVGKKLRKYRLDELPQLFNILAGDMTFVGTRPEVPGYVACYTDEMMATLLLPAGVTSEASIEFKDEDRLMTNVDDADETYVNVVLPRKMKYNLKALKNFGLIRDIAIMVKTVKAVVD